MRTVVLCSYLIGVLIIAGCSRSNVGPPDHLDHQQSAQEKAILEEENAEEQKLKAAHQWITDVNVRDKAERDAALQQAPDRNKAMAMEVAAMNVVYQKRLQFSHQPKFNSLSRDQKLQGNEDIITKGLAAKSEMRRSHYQILFHPMW